MMMNITIMRVRNEGDENDEDDEVDEVDEDVTDEGDEDHAALRRGEHQDRQGNPGHRRDRPRHLEGRHQRLPDPAEAEPGVGQKW